MRNAINSIFFFNNYIITRMSERMNVNSETEYMNTNTFKFNTMMNALGNVDSSYKMLDEKRARAAAKKTQREAEKAKRDQEAVNRVKTEQRMSTRRTAALMKENDMDIDGGRVKKTHKTKK